MNTAPFSGCGIGGAERHRKASLSPPPILLKAMIAVAAGYQCPAPGLLKGKVWMADDFDETPEWLIRAFENSEIFPPEQETG